MESENEDLKNAKDKLEADKEELKTENTRLKADLTKEEEEVNKLKSDISELNQSHMKEVHVLNLQLSEKDKDIRKMVISVCAVYTRYIMPLLYLLIVILCNAENLMTLIRPFSFIKGQKLYIYKVNRKAIKNVFYAYVI